MHCDIGWYIKGKLIHSAFAFTDWECWLSHFRSTFPDNAIKMDEYSTRQGWCKWYADKVWYEVIIGWLDKQPIQTEQQER